MFFFFSFFFFFNFFNFKDQTKSSSIKTTTRDDLPPCTWQYVPGKYLPGCFQNCKQFTTLETAKTYCLQYLDCGGVTVTQGGVYELREGINPEVSPSGENSWFISNEFQCKEITPDPAWKARGEMAYMGLNRTDKDAIWSYQG